jgi:hypothetical protein
MLLCVFIVFLFYIPRVQENHKGKRTHVESQYRQSKEKKKRTNRQNQITPHRSQALALKRPKDVSWVFSDRPLYLLLVHHFQGFVG